LDWFIRLAVRPEPSEDRALQPARKRREQVKLNFTPGWEVDISGGTAGLCQPVERDLFDCYLGCGWPAQVPDHLNNAPDWTDKCASATNDWRKVDIVFP
jgi:hypothetical protein